MTPFAAGLLEAKRQSEPGAPQIPVTIYRAGEKFTVGPFAFEAIPVAHSIPEPMSLAITTPAGTIIHTGDWKIDPDPAHRAADRRAALSRARRRRRAGADLQFHQCLREGNSPSEKAVGASLRKLIEEAKGRVAITSFSSNVGRIR